MTGGSALERDRQAFERQAWGAAYALLCAADEDAPLGAEDLERSGGWIGRARAVIDDGRRDFVILDAGRRWATTGAATGTRCGSTARRGRRACPGCGSRPRRREPTWDQMADFLETCAATFDLPVRTGVRVTRLARHGREYLVTSDGPAFRCDNVVVASGTFGRTPSVPGFADALDPGILQLPSSADKNLPQLRPGGRSQS